MVVIQGPFADGDPGSDAVLRSAALSSVARQISVGLIARAARHILLAFITTIFTVAVLWPAAFAAVAGHQPADVARGLAYVMATPILGLVNGACTLGPTSGRSRAAIWLVRCTSSAASALTRLRRAALSGVQIGALMHRRNHGGIHKIEACVHASKDGPKNLGAAVQPTCLDCAAWDVNRRASRAWPPHRRPRELVDGHLRLLPARL